MKYAIYIVNIINQSNQLVLAVFRRLIFKKIVHSNVQKILVIRKGTIGDHVVCQPIYIGLRAYFNDAQIHLLTSNGGNAYAHISKLPENKLFDKYFNFEDFSTSELRNLISKEKYTLAIELPQDVDTQYTQIRNMFFFRFCGIPYGIGWHATNHYVFKKQQYLATNHLRQFEKHRVTLKNQGLKIDFKETYLPIQKQPTRNIVAIAPGAKILAKTWPLENYKLIAKQINQLGFEVAIIGSKEDGRNWENTTYSNYCGTMTVDETRVFLGSCKLLICNDSGPMHLTYSVETPLIALFGTRNYPKTWWPPENPKYLVLHKPNPSNPLAFIQKRNSKLDNQIDKNLLSISVEEVMKAFKVLI